MTQREERRQQRIARVFRLILGWLYVGYHIALVGAVFSTAGGGVPPSAQIGMTTSLVIWGLLIALMAMVLVQRTHQFSFRGRILTFLFSSSFVLSVVGIVPFSAGSGG